MTQIPISQKISDQYSSFSKQQRKVADYVMNNIDNIMYFPMSRFVEEIGVSKATLVRFAQHLGYEGFNDFKEALFSHYRVFLSPETRMRRSIEAIENVELSYEMIASRELQFLQSSIASVDNEIFKAAVKQICSAETLYIIGHGANEHMATYLHFRLRRLRIPCKLVAASGRDICEHFLTLNERDAAVVYNFSRPSSDFLRIMNILNDHAVPSVLITDMRTPASTDCADHVLYAERGPQGIFPSPIVPMGITFALILGVEDQLKSKAIDALKRLAELRDTYIYNPRDTKKSCK